jgi:hypothetical protein
MVAISDLRRFLQNRPSVATDNVPEIPGCIVREIVARND